MKQTISLKGSWEFCMDSKMEGLEKHFEEKEFSDSILLPGTISLSQKGTPKQDRHTDHLTDPYEMEGFCWYRRQADLPIFPLDQDCRILLSLERTRISHLWVDGRYAGTCDSLNAPHCYDLTSCIRSAAPVITIMVSNTGYKIPGGHLTSPDTQTNWLGILGSITLTVCQGPVLSDARLRPRRAKTKENSSSWQPSSNPPGLPGRSNGEASPFIADRHNTPLELTFDACCTGHAGALALTVSTRLCRLSRDYSLPASDPADSSDNPTILEQLCDKSEELSRQVFTFTPDDGQYSGSFPLDLPAPDGRTQLWSEFEPDMYYFSLQLSDASGEVLDEKTLLHGRKDFTAEGGHFCINGQQTFLRGKHDGMIFPLTGFAPMDLAGWLGAMRTIKSYGINHYRFHTCCPPEAAFLAADLLGIYLEPELPFWGTFCAPGDDGYDEAAAAYLREEGFRILSAFSHHPSFCMLSLGNELWGNREALDALLAEYKEEYPDILFTQGSNTFQFDPKILPNDDFFCGVRFSMDRRFRGSYAMCDAPQGHIQTMAPTTLFSYEDAFYPDRKKKQDSPSPDKPKDWDDSISIPVISHEIGQYCMYPDFREISHYTGVLKAENYSIFKERLEAKRLGHLADAFFQSSGALAVSCYKDELETAFRTPSLAGFQILDLQDFSGQGTAVVGILNALLENKGLISASRWRQFCSDAVLLASFDSYLVTAGEAFTLSVSLAWFRPEVLPDPVLLLSLTDSRNGETVLAEKHKLKSIRHAGRHKLKDLTLPLPDLADAGAREYLLHLEIQGTGIENDYTLWSYRPLAPEDPSPEMFAVAFHLADALAMAKEKKSILLFLPEEENPSSIEGTYCTDFWCYPMFRDIAKDMGKAEPVGTLGLLIDAAHPALAAFPCKTYSTPQWYSIVTASRSTILDDTDIQPIVMTIDNFDRNHRLGMIYEVFLTDTDTSMLICTSSLPRLIKEGRPEAALLCQSLAAYAASQDASSCNGKYKMNTREFLKLFQVPE